MSNRKIYDKEKVKLISLSVVATKYPELTHEAMKDLAYSDDQIQYIYQRLLVADMVDKLLKDDPCGNSDYYKSEAEWIVNNVQPELVQNINEWIDGMPLTPIAIHGKTIESIMNQFAPDRIIFFTQAVKCLIRWKENNYMCDSFCEDFFALR